MDKLVQTNVADLDRAKSFLRRYTAAPYREPERGAGHCDLCENTGWRPVQGGVVRCEPCLARARGQAPGVPKDEQDSRLANFKETAANRKALEEARLFLDGVHPNLYLCGGVGRGKTRLACSLLNEIYQGGTGVEFFRTARLLSTLLPGADDIDKQIERIAAVPVICLDDVGSSQASDFARRALVMIFEARIDQDHRTIFTSNLDLDELQQFTGDDRLSSRIAGNAKVVEVGGDDWRLKARMARRRT